MHSVNRVYVHIDRNSISCRLSILLLLVPAKAIPLIYHAVGGSLSAARRS